jgi:hypothetical protein
MSTVNGGWSGPKIVKDGLVLYLDAGSPNSYFTKTSTSIKDISGNGNNGTLNNFGSQTIYNSSNGGSIIFDGVDDYFTTNSTIAIQTNDRTFEVWVKFNSSGSTGFYPLLQQISLFSSTNSNNITGLQKISGGYTIINPVANGTTFNAYSGGFDFRPYIGSWIHIVGTIQGSVSSKIYLNGSLVSDVAITINPQQVGRYITTGYHTGPNINLATSIVYNKALSSTEVLQNYNAQKGRFGL